MVTLRGVERAQRYLEDVGADFPRRPLEERRVLAGERRKRVLWSVRLPDGFSPLWPWTRSRWARHLPARITVRSRTPGAEARAMPHPLSAILQDRQHDLGRGVSQAALPACSTVTATVRMGRIQHGKRRRREMILDNDGTGTHASTRVFLLRSGCRRSFLIFKRSARICRTAPQKGAYPAFQRFQSRALLHSGGAKTCRVRLPPVR